MAKLMVSLCRLASLDDCKKERENNYVIKRDFKYAIIDGSSSIFSFFSSCFETMSLLEIIFESILVWKLESSYLA